MSRKISVRELDRKPGVDQIVQLPRRAEVVGFLNRQGTPALVTLWPVEHKPGVESATVILLQNHSEVPEGTSYVGSAEFSGGQALLHCFIRRGGAT